MDKEVKKLIEEMEKARAEINREMMKRTIEEGSGMKIDEMIKKYNLRFQYMKRGAKTEEVIAIGEEIDHESEDYKFMKAHKSEILRTLKRRKAEEEERKNKEYKEDFRKRMKGEYPDQFEKAKETGTDQEIGSWTEPCRDRKEDANIELVVRYVRPDGTIYVKRQPC